jgi:hypothetical protein
MKLEAGVKVLFSPNTTDQEIIENGIKKLIDMGIDSNLIITGYDIQILEKNDLFVSYDPPDLVVRIVYDKKISGIVKMRTQTVIRM